LRPKASVIALFLSRRMDDSEVGRRIEAGVAAGGRRIVPVGN